HLHSRGVHKNDGVVATKPYARAPPGDRIPPGELVRGGGVYADLRLAARPPQRARMQERRVLRRPGPRVDAMAGCGKPMSQLSRVVHDPACMRVRRANDGEAHVVTPHAIER